MSPQIEFTFWVVFLVFLCGETWSLCPVHCDCKSAPTSCPIGVSLITDGCGCCKICAKQLNEKCNNEMALCDPHRNLYCDFSSSPGQWGVCNVERGRSCVHNGILMVSGTTFKPSCKKECQCLDGSFACLMKCPHESQAPLSILCPNARLQSVNGQCCDEWVCDRLGIPQGSNPDPTLDTTMRYQGQPDSLLASEMESLFTNKVNLNSAYEWNGGTDGDELFEQNTENLYSSNTRNSEEYNWEDTNNLPGEETFIRSGTESRHLSNCQEKQSQWSTCSKTCGLGVSSRVSNANSDCRFKRETRLCFIKPCEEDFKTPQLENRKCSRGKISENPVTFSYAGCTIDTELRPRFCENCKNRCCSPRTSDTIPIRFRCSDGRVFSKNFMSIRSCRCSRRECSEEPSVVSQKQQPSRPASNLIQSVIET